MMVSLEEFGVTDFRAPKFDSTKVDREIYEFADSEREKARATGTEHRCLWTTALTAPVPYFPHGWSQKTRPLVLTTESGCLQCARSLRRRDGALEAR